MAIARAICTCEVCGNEFEKTAKKYNRREADSWEKWAATNYTLCPSCYGKQKREEEKAKGLYVDVRLDIRTAVYPGKQDRRVAYIFGGDTYPVKEKLKSLGTRWTDDYPEDGFLGGLLSIKKPVKKWVLYSTVEDMADTLEKIEQDAGAKINSLPSRDSVLVEQAARKATGKDL